ncbi:uncharacterized protein LOC133785104 [Humulus lupulus]|uniref:uncharacterized protein LOC133785104 n=1 Tax=Humulus lupulus TaxID=3486 RepID=UPI002B408D69|nr:uncharacterized protein LOC133785104 [Humulus lupulus]
MAETMASAMERYSIFFASGTSFGSTRGWEQMGTTRNDELKDTQSIELACKILNDEIESGTWLNQIGTLKQARDTRWGSHLDSISSLLKMFNATCLQELNFAFNEHSVELLVLSTAFDPRDGFKLFKLDDTCNFAEKYYPDDFSEQEVVSLRIELQHFVLDIPNHPEL